MLTKNSSGTGAIVRTTGAKLTTPDIGAATATSITTAALSVTALSNGKIPYHVSDASGFADGPTKTDVDDAVTKKHAQQHAITSTSDHTSTATAGQILKADANGLPVDATNTDTDVASAVSLKHAALTIDGTSPLSLSGQAISLKNDSAAAITEVDTAATPENSTLKIPCSKQLYDHAALAVGVHGLGNLTNAYIPYYDTTNGLTNGPLYMSSGGVVNYHGPTDANRTGLNIAFRGVITTNASVYHIGEAIAAGVKVGSGVTNSGYLYSMNLSAFRNYTTTADSGTLASLVAILGQYGHYNSDATATPITTNAYGLNLSQVRYTGTITNMYGIYITETGSATVTNQYGIYIGNLTGTTAYSILTGSAQVKFGGPFGCNNATPRGKATVNAACSDLTTAVALLNQIRTALIDNGICQ